MARAQSNMLDLGTVAPSFTLRDAVSRQPLSLASMTQGKKATVIMFICNHCPFVKHINHELVTLANDYLSKDVLFIAINSNDVSAYPEDSPENMKRVAEALSYPFPYLYDETQIVAKDYKAACTPDFYIFDNVLALQYRGQLDDSRPGNHIAVTGASIRAALDAILMGQAPDFDQKPSIGCGIKWIQSA